MPTVAVYVPAATWRALEAQGDNPAQVVRAIVTVGLEELQRAEAPLQLVNPDPAGVSVSITSSFGSAAPKKRTETCIHRVGPDAYCGKCDAA